MKPELQDILIRGLNEIGCGEDHFPPTQFSELISDLARYHSEILKWNEKIGLVRASERELIIKHYLDSAAPLRWFQDHFQNHTTPPTQPAQLDIADLGSGVGLPGIMLALLFKAQNNIRIHLVEKQARRAKFLHSTLETLNLTQSVQLHHTRAETLTQRFDLVTSRAYAKLTPETCRTQMQLLKPSGHIVAYKGKRETILQDFRGSIPEEAQIIPLRVPFLEAERHLFVLQNLLV